jgi:hypothetical protein
MTERFKQLIVCECGHEGFVRRLESDWRRHEQYWLDGFTGGAITVTCRADEPADILLALTPKCPRCETGAVTYAIPRTAAWQWESA